MVGLPQTRKTLENWREQKYCELNYKCGAHFCMRLLITLLSRTCHLLWGSIYIASLFEFSVIHLNCVSGLLIPMGSSKCTEAELIFSLLFVLGNGVNSKEYIFSKRAFCFYIIYKHSQTFAFMLDHFSITSLGIKKM